MSQKRILALDLSTSCIGWSTLDQNCNLLTYGCIEPDKKGLTKLEYPFKALEVMERLATEVYTLVLMQKPDLIVIEEITGSGIASRLAQKTLDGFHYIIAQKLKAFASKIKYIDVSGTDGWRTYLSIRLSAQDKINNKENKALNKKIGRGQKKLNIINWKNLSCRWVNDKFNLNLDPDMEESHGDIADSICLGYAFIKESLTNWK